MDFEDIINDFHIKLDNILNQIPQNEYSSFITFIPLNLYKKSMSKTRSFNNAFNDINSFINLKLKEYKNSIDDIETSSYHFNLNQKEILQYNLDNLEKDLQEKVIDFTNQINELKNKEFKTSSRYRDTVNEIDINKNLINLEYNSYLPDIKEHYNKSKDIFGFDTSSKNDQSHAKISKELYMSNDASSQKIEEISIKIEKNLKSIENIEDEIDTRSKRVNDKIFKKEVELNNTINSLTISNNEKKKLNNIQTNIMLESINSELNQVIDKYNKKRQRLSLNHQEKFQELDNQIDEETFKYNQLINELNHKHAILRFKAQKKYNDSILKNNNIINNKNTKKLNKLAYKEFQLFNKSLQNEINYIDKEFKNNINNLRMQKYILVNRRKYDFQILELEENEEKHRLEIQIETTINDKNRFIQKLDNDLSKIVNRYRLGFDIEKNNINKNYKLFELSRKQSIAKLNLQINQNKNLKEKYELENKLTNEYHKNRDINKQNLNTLENVLKIEKNKYLVKFNNSIVNIKIEYNNNSSSYDLDYQTCLYNKNIKLINEEIDYINKCQSYFIKHSSLIKQKEINNFSNEINSNDIIKEVKIINLKNEFKVNKLKYDINLLDNLFKYNEEIIKLYGKVINQTINIIVKYVKNHLTNCEYIVNILNNLSNIYIDLVNNFYKSTLNLTKKILNSRVTFEIGNKYNIQIEKINEKYDEIIKKYNENNTVCNSTLLNYKIQKFEIKAKMDLNSRKIIDSKNIREKLKKVKENFVFSRQLKKIDDFINEVNEITENIKNNIKRNNALKILELRKIDTVKNADFIINNQAISKFEILYDKILQSISCLKNCFNYKTIVIFKNLNSSSSLFKKKIINICNTSSIKSFKILNDFYLKEIKSASILKDNNINHFNNLDDVRVKSFNKKSKALTNNIIQNNEEYRLISLNHTLNNKSIENDYYKELDIKKNNFNIKNESLNKKLHNIKNESFKIFDTCDKNSYHIINSLINENKYKKEKNENDKALISKEYVIKTDKDKKEYNHLMIKLKKEKKIINKIAEYTQKELKKECVLKNNKLENDSKELEIKSKLESKKHLKDVELYSFKTRKRKIKEKKLNYLEIKNIKRNFKKEL